MEKKKAENMMQVHSKIGRQKEKLPKHAIFAKRREVLGGLFIISEHLELAIPG